ncbi:rRNA maturation RNase YbeY [Candidatus Microgenomates bacterium]|nr:rRNA maturation RNase YbeY [Candidatus Microgenomates bacterium]
MIKLKMQFADGLEPINSQFVGKVVRELNKTLPDASDGIVNIRVTSALEVKDLNQRYAGRPQDTDVLSFNYREGGPLLSQEIGDVIVSYDHVIKQAKATQTDEMTELALLILHGMLHIMGYDHQSKVDQQTMNDLQATVMANAGLTYRDFAWKE